LPEGGPAGVLAVVYLIFNQGWGGGRVDLAAEALHLGRALAGPYGRAKLSGLRAGRTVKSARR
jgi:predicted RNA polymerase sigma factor